MNFRLLFVLLTALHLIAGCQGMAQNGRTADGRINTTVNVIDFQTKLNQLKDVQIIDVRTPEEYNEGHLANSKNINIRTSNFEQQLAMLDKTKPVMVYCRSGGRSANAAQKMDELGFQEVYNMDGGITQWEHAKLPTTK